MAIFNCCACGGAFDAGNLTYVQCPHCGTPQNVPQPAQAVPQQATPQYATQQTQAAKFTQPDAQNEKKSKKKKVLIIIAIILAVSFIPLCILAAMLVPSFLAYKDNSDKKSFIQACDTIKICVMQEISEQYAETGETPTQSTLDWSAVSSSVGKQVSNDGSGEYTVTFTFNDNNLSRMTVTDGEYTGTYENGSWTIT